MFRLLCHGLKLAVAAAAQHTLRRRFLLPSVSTPLTSSIQTSHQWSAFTSDSEKDAVRQLFTCNFCSEDGIGQRFNSPNQLSEHIRSFHAKLFFKKLPKGKKPLPLDRWENVPRYKCGHYFPKEAQLLDHMRSPYDCPVYPGQTLTNFRKVEAGIPIGAGVCLAYHINLRRHVITPSIGVVGTDSSQVYELVQYCKGEAKAHSDKFEVPMLMSHMTSVSLYFTRMRRIRSDDHGAVAFFGFDVEGPQLYEVNHLGQYSPKKLEEPLTVETVEEAVPIARSRLVNLSPPTKVKVGVIGEDQVLKFF